ncbi:hypothetical protein [Bradyrhizobium sp. SZCCHNR1085]|nr:hypothetical protein [Bradyrhizobium sp. SZCCHNR1085]
MSGIKPAAQELMKQREAGRSGAGCRKAGRSDGHELRHHTPNALS